MYIMSWVGIATTIGLVIEGPILLRSLADSLANVNLDHLPLGFHPSLLAALDDGVATESPSRLVDSYACDWWRHNTEPTAGQTFGTNTLDECLNSYRQYIPAPSISHSFITYVYPATKCCCRLPGRLPILQRPAGSHSGYV